MPAITSAFSALRLSGRLMLIQNAWPRLSRMTLSFSVIAVPARWCRGPICGRSVADRKDDFRSVISGMVYRTRVYPNSAILLSKSASADLDGPNPESRDSGLGASHRPGMTTSGTCEPVAKEPRLPGKRARLRLFCCRSERDNYTSMEEAVGRGTHEIRSGR